MAQNRLFHQLARIQKVLRLVVLTGPTAFRVQFDAKEVTDIPEQTIPNNTQQFSVTVVDGNFRAGANFPLKLNASSRKGNVFEVRDRASVLAGFASPDQFYQFGT